MVNAQALTSLADAIGDRSSGRHWDGDGEDRDEGVESHSDNFVLGGGVKES